MIAEGLISRAAKLTSWWDTQRDGINVLALDYSWPSLGVLDLLAHVLRGGISGEEREDFLQCLCAYLGIIGQEAWKGLGQEVGEEPELVELSDGISLRLGSLTSPTGRVHLLINLSQSLKNLLRADVGELQVLPSFWRYNITPRTNLVSLFGIGMLTGLWPQAAGVLARRSYDSAQSQIEKVVRMCARSCGLSYQDIFPDEKIGQVGELYLNDLIYPPYFMNEAYPLERGLAGFIEWARTFRLSNQQMREVARNLALMPDETIASLGLVIYAALVEDVIDTRVLSVAEGLGAHMILLRRALVDVRSRLFGGTDWLQNSNLSQSSLERYYFVERKMGFLPPLLLPASYLADKKYRAVLGHFTHLQFPEALKAQSHLAGERKTDLHYRLQRASLALMFNEEDKAKEDFDFFSQNEAGISPLLRSLFLAEYHLSMGDRQASLTVLRDCLAGKSEASSEMRSEAGIRLVASYLGLGQYKEALRELDRFDPKSMSSMGSLSRIVANRKLGKEVEPLKALDDHPGIWPTNRDVFAALFLLV